MSNSDRKLVLHIGIPDNGNVYLQHFLRSNDELLAHQQISYPKPFMAPFIEMNDFSWHPSIVATTASALNMDANPERLSNLLKRSFSIHSNKSAKLFQRTFRRRFERHLSQKKFNTMVLSIEQLTTSIRQPEQLSFLKNFISNYFTKFEIVIYLKSQEELINSYLSYYTMLGLDSSYDSLVNVKANDYYEFLKPWWDTFGIENMNIRIVDRDFLDNEDIISDFFHLIGGEQYSLFSQPIILDEAMSNQAMYFLQRFNKFAPHSETSETIDPDRIDLSESLEAFSEGKHGLLLSGDRIRGIRSKYHHSNEKLKAIFFPERAELFPIKIIKETVKESLTSESTLEIAAFLWKHQQSKIKSLQKQTKQLRRQLINKNQSNDTSIS